MLTADEWEVFSRASIDESEKQRRKCASMRSITEEVLQRTVNDLESQKRITDSAFIHRIQETRSAKDKLENQLLKVACVMHDNLLYELIGNWILHDDDDDDDDDDDYDNDDNEDELIFVYASLNWNTNSEVRVIDSWNMTVKLAPQLHVLFIWQTNNDFANEVFVVVVLYHFWNRYGSK